MLVVGCFVACCLLYVDVCLLLGVCFVVRCLLHMFVRLLYVGSWCWLFVFLLFRVFCCLLCVLFFSHFSLLFVGVRCDVWLAV